MCRIKYTDAIDNAGVVEKSSQIITVNQGIGPLENIPVKAKTVSSVHEFSADLLRPFESLDDRMGFQSAAVIRRQFRPFMGHKTDGQIRIEVPIE